MTQNKPHVDTSSFQVVPFISGDDAEDTELLKNMTEEAIRYIGSFEWSNEVKTAYLAYGIGGVVALFLVVFVEPVGDRDTELWVVVGDVPYAYFVTDAARAPAEALNVYCDLMEDWAATVLQNGELSDVFPVEADASIENAFNLQRRIEFLRNLIE